MPLVPWTTLILSLATASPTGLAAEGPLAAREARIRYLGHSGWAVETRSRLLVFDYQGDGNVGEEPSLSSGRIDPAEIKDRSVIVFVSHGHGDHWSPGVLEWRRTVRDITYVFGWQADQGPDHIYCDRRREEFTLGDVKIRTIVHDFDGIPEAAFVVEVDGLTIFHSGDHGNGPPPFKERFVDNIEYVARVARQIDLAFVPLWGEETFVVETLRPKHTFPMHARGREKEYRAFAARAAEESLPTRVIAAEAPGDTFVLSRGKVRSATRRP